MIDVLVILMAVVVVVLVVTTKRATAVRKRSGRSDLLVGLAPVVSGSIGGDLVLGGTYRGHAVRISLHTADPAPPGMSVSSDRYDIETMRVRLLGAAGSQPWAVWHEPTLTGRTWHFARPDGADVAPFLGRVARLGGMPPADPALPDRLRDAGILEAFDRLGPPTDDSFPRIRYLPDLRPLMAERLRAAGRQRPSSAADRSEELQPRLEVEVERSGAADPTPERFRAILDAVLEIAEINARANPTGLAPS